MHPQPKRASAVIQCRGGHKGVRILQNHTELCINTTQNNIRKQQTTLKLPEKFLIPQTAWFCKAAIPQLKIKISAKTAP